MFTGIIRATGLVYDLVRVEGQDRLCQIETNGAFSTALGESMACSGVCLTVMAQTESTFSVQLSPETWEKTTARFWIPGETRLNLEPSLRLGDSLDGHFVTGHVDGIAKIYAVTSQGTSREFILATDPKFRPFLAAKGSVALDGVSLTLNRVWTDKEEGTKEVLCFFSVNLIPYSLTETNFSSKIKEDNVNLEIDLVSRYVANFLEAQR